MSNGLICIRSRALADAEKKRDLDALMTCYLDDKDAIFFEDTIPFQLVGTNALRKYRLPLLPVGRSEARGPALVNHAA